MNRDHIELWQILLLSASRYFAFAGATYLLFYVWKRRKWLRFKIQQKFPKKSAIRTEMLYSASTALIFSVTIYIFLFSPVKDHTRLYFNIHEHSVVWFVASVFIYVIVHDTYFYWTHRLMHWKLLFPYVHHIHHKSHNPTPLAAFSFHPFEALIAVGILPLMVMSIPLHPVAAGLAGLYVAIINVIGHLGYELFPERLSRTRFFRLFNTSTHHNMHHHYGKGNYGLFFNLWDRFMGTNHKQYEEEFVIVTRRAREKKNVVH